jgi:hypothetical protein
MGPHTKWHSILRYSTARQYSTHETRKSGINDDESRQDDELKDDEHVDETALAKKKSGSKRSL